MEDAPYAIAAVAALLAITGFLLVVAGVQARLDTRARLQGFVEARRQAFTRKVEIGRRRQERAAELRRRFQDLRESAAASAAAGTAQRPAAEAVAPLSEPAIREEIKKDPEKAVRIVKSLLTEALPD